MSGPVIIPAIADDGSLYPIEKIEAHRSGVLHLAVSIFVTSSDALLMQKRATVKYHCGGLWANTCCSHPHWGEDVAICAARRMREELGICIEMTTAGIVEYRTEVGDGLIEHERVHMFRASADPAEIRLSLDPKEVEDTRWVTAKEILHSIKDSPELFAPWFRIYVDRHPDIALPGVR